MKRRLQATFAALSIRNYRLFFTGQTISVMGSWMQKIAQAWLVLELTGSGTMLGITAALQHLPALLIGPWGGLLADRADKYKMLLWTQSAAAVPALLLGLLTATDQIALWMVLALALALGLVEAFDKPARHSFVIEIVGGEHMTNAVALHTIMINIGRVTGPAVAGVLIGTVGMAMTFFVNGASYLAVVIGLLLMRRDQLQPSAPAKRGRGQLREGLRYVRGHPALLGPLALLTVSGLLAFEWAVTLPLLAYDTFDADVRVAGLMFTTMGAGAIIGGLFLAGTLQATTNRLVLACVVFSLLLIGAAASPTLTVLLLVLALVGASSVAFRAVAQSFVQLRADPTMRGRVMSLVVIAVVGTTPIGGPLVGWIGETFGARVAVGIGGVVTAIAALVTLVYLRHHNVRDADSVDLVNDRSTTLDDPVRPAA